MAQKKKRHPFTGAVVRNRDRKIDLVCGGPIATNEEQSNNTEANQGHR
jgi:hypothetical protein